MAFQRDVGGVYPGDSVADGCGGEQGTLATVLCVGQFAMGYMGVVCIDNGMVDLQEFVREGMEGWGFG